MTGVSMKELIRRDHFIHRKSIRQIARERHMARKTIRAALRDAGPTLYKRKKTPQAPILDPVKSIIAEILQQDQANPRKQRHTAKRIYQRLRDEHQFQGAESTVRRYIARVRAKLPPVFLPLEFDPGMDAQVDWGEVDVILDGTQLTVQMFCCKLRASGAFFVACFPIQKQEAFFEAHVRAFEFFGGVPHRITYDNLTTAVKHVLVGKRREEQTAFVTFRSHHLFEAHFCTPGIRGAHEKGGVENLVGYARRNFLVPLPEIASFDQLNCQLERQCRQDQDRKMPGETRTIAEAFAQERQHLRPLPARRYECCRRLSVRADSCSRIAFETNHYSVPVEHAHKTFALKAFTHRIVLCLGSTIVAEHPRHHGRHQEIFDPLHYIPLLLTRPGALRYAKPIRRWKWPQIYDRYHDQLCEHLPDGRGTREFIKVLLLHRDFPAETIEVGISLALEYRAYGFDALHNILLQLTTDTQRHLPIDLSDRRTLATIKIAEFRPDQYNRLLAGGAQ